MKYLITFGGEAYDSIIQRIVENAPKYGVDKVLVYDDWWLTQQDFYTLNQWCWQHPHKRGFGWYVWKPYVIQHALSQCNAGDVVLYCDSDTQPIANLSPLYDQCIKDGGIMLFAVEGREQVKWCKADTYAVMGQLDLMKDAQAMASVARFMLFQKGPWKANQFLQEWLTYCVNPLANTFDKSILMPENAAMVEPRCEQAILTNLAHKYKLELYREADATGTWSNRHKDLYGQLFVQVDIDSTNIKTTKPVNNGSKFRNV